MAESDETARPEHVRIDENGESSPAGVVLAGAAVLVLLFAWRRFLGGLHSPFVSDIRHYHHPVTREIVRAWEAGRIPLWTEHTYLGFPFLADPQTAFWYPGTLLVAGLGPHWGYVGFLVLHSLLAAVGMMALLRSHGVARSIGWGCGLTLALCGYFAHEAQHPGLYAILCWMPAWLWTTHRLFRAPSARRVAASALVVALMLFAGTLQVMFGALLFYAFYLLGLFLDAREERGRVGALKPMGPVAAAQLLGAAMAAVMLIPAIAHLPLTARSLGMTYAFASMGSVHPLELLRLFFNAGAASHGSETEFDYAGVSFYLGSLVLPLATVGVLASRRKLPAVLGSALVLLTFVAMGRHAGLHALLYEWAPAWVGGLRGMGRALGPVSLGLVLLAGLGLQGLRSPGRTLRVQFVSVSSVALLAFVWMQSAAEEPLSIYAVGSGLCLVAAVSLFGLPLLPASQTGGPGGALETWLERPLPKAVGINRQQAFLLGLLLADLVVLGPLDRVLTANPPPPRGGGIPDEIPELTLIAESNAAGPAPRLMLHGFGPLNIPLLQGIDGVGGYNPLVTLQYLDFVHLTNRGTLFPRAPLDQFVSGAKPQRFESPLFDAASVASVVSNRPTQTRGLHRVRSFAGTRLGELGASLYVNRDALPRSYLAYHTVRAMDEGDLERLLGLGFDPRRQTVVEGDAPLLRGSEEITPVVRTSSRPERADFAVAPEAPAILVVTQSWYPGWRAWVNGKESPVFRVNANFQGVALPAGVARVTMRFEPWTFRLGAGVSLAALGTGLVLAVRPSSRRAGASSIE